VLAVLVVYQLRWQMLVKEYRVLIQYLEALHLLAVVVVVVGKPK
jgi:hypothetical protein